LREREGGRERERDRRQRKRERETGRQRENLLNVIFLTPGPQYVDFIFNHVISFDDAKNDRERQHGPCSEIAASLLPTLKIYNIRNVHYRICSTDSNFGTRPCEKTP